MLYYSIIYNIIQYYYIILYYILYLRVGGWVGHTSTHQPTRPPFPFIEAIHSSKRKGWKGTVLSWWPGGWVTHPPTHPTAHFIHSPFILSLFSGFINLSKRKGWKRKCIKWVVAPTESTAWLVLVGEWVGGCVTHPPTHPLNSLSFPFLLNESIELLRSKEWKERN